MKKKIVALCLCVALLAVAIAGASLAYFTDKTGSLTNTFTVGKVAIKLDETTGENYHVVPGTEIAKDPKVTVEANSEASYVFVKVEESQDFAALAEKLTYGMAEGWTELDNVDGVYYRVVNKSENNQVFPVLANNKVTVSDKLTQDDLDKKTSITLTFTAYAIQAKGFDTPAAAWAEVNK